MFLFFLCLMIFNNNNNNIIDYRMKMSSIVGFDRWIHGKGRKKTNLRGITRKQNTKLIMKMSNTCLENSIFSYCYQLKREIDRKWMIAFFLGFCMPSLFPEALLLLLSILSVIFIDQTNASDVFPSMNSSVQRWSALISLPPPSFFHSFFSKLNDEKIMRNCNNNQRSNIWH